jgi:surface protein
MEAMLESCDLITTVPLFDTHNVTDMSEMLWSCASLTTVPLFDTSNVTDMANMLSNCDKLTSIPLFNTSKVTNVNGMCAYCYKVQSGALALYNQMSTQATPPANHDRCFKECGSNTTTGAAELAQIPEDWK